MPAPAMKVFVSYSHCQEDWVWNRLVPCLKAGGAEVLIDRERFKPGRTVVGQMDAVQDQADIHVLILSPDYLASAFCTHEMDRAIAKDPTFARGLVIPVMRVDCRLPPQIALPNPPLYIDLRDDRKPAPWQQLLSACCADLGTDAVHWLDVRDELRQSLQRDVSANLVVVGQNVKWAAMIDDLAGVPGTRMSRVDLNSAWTNELPGLLACLLRSEGSAGPCPPAPRSLIDFQCELLARPSVSRVALTHFDMVTLRGYDVNFFTTLRYLVTDARKLVLLVESRAPIMTLLPQGLQTGGSPLVVQNVRLRGRP
jgi:hypothetical protein